jgi:hypothetical protein
MPYHSEEEIKQQVTYALSYQKQQKWHNSEHFAHWCRHGKKVGTVKERKTSDTAKWASLRASAAAWMFTKTRRRRNSSE